MMSLSWAACTAADHPAELPQRCLRPSCSTRSAANAAFWGHACWPSQKIVGFRRFRPRLCGELVGGCFPAGPLMSPARRAHSKGTSDVSG